MRTATPETVRALRAAIETAAVPYSTWARAHGLSSATAHDALHDKPMSAKRENTIRAALELPPLRWQVVELLEGQKIVTSSKPPRNRRRAVTLTPEQAAEWDAIARANGYRSTGQMILAEFAPDGPLD